MWYTDFNSASPDSAVNIRWERGAAEMVLYFFALHAAVTVDLFT